MSQLILIKGRIVTQDQALPEAEALAAEGGRIVALGPSEEIKGLARPGARVVDLGGRLCLPGFSDNHIHFHDWAHFRKALPLAEAGSLEDLLAMTAERHGQTEGQGWVLGRGLDEADWAEPRLPTRNDLDPVAAEHPVLLYRRDMHLAAVNTKALELAGVTAETPDPEGGVLDRDETGEPTGVLRETAIDLVSGSIPAPTEAESAQAMAEAMPVLQGMGLTGLTDQRIWKGLDQRQAFRAWMRLHEQGGVGMRVWVNLSGEMVGHLADLGLATGFGDDWLRLGHLKYFTDGSIGARTAWMLEPFVGGGRGLPVCSMAELGEQVLAADRAGLAVAVHAIGDRANRELIDILERTVADRAKRRSGIRPRIPHRIEHGQLMREPDILRLAKLPVMVSAQPAHIADDITVHEDRLGSDGYLAYRFKEMLTAGVGLVFSSDCPVSEPNPFLGIHSAVTRQRVGGHPEGGWYPDQRLTVDQAVRAYTLGTALVTGRTASLGSLSPGKLADLIVLDRNIYEIDPAEIAGTQVDLTVIDGRVAYER